MQAKDCPELPILHLLGSKDGWWSMHGPEISVDRSVHPAFPPDAPYKVMLAKMSSLIRRGLVSGCDCGCRGDFELTAAGRSRLAHLSHEK